MEKFKDFLYNKNDIIIALLIIIAAAAVIFFRVRAIMFYPGEDPGSADITDMVKQAAASVHYILG